MGREPIDASFEENTVVSELDGAQIYDPSSRRERPANKPTETKPEKKRENSVNAIDASFDDDSLSEAGIIEAEEVRPTVKKAAAKPRPKPHPAASRPASRPQDRALVRTEKREVVRAEKKPREPITFSSMRRGLASIMSTRSDVRVRTVKNGQKKPLPVSAFAMAFICILLLMFMIVSYVQINEYTVVVSELRSDLGEMVDRDKELSLALEKKNDMLLIEQKAGELGMVKVDQLTKKHVAIAQEDKIEVIEPEPTYDSTVVTTIMASIWENFAGLREYLG